MYVSRTSSQSVSPHGDGVSGILEFLFHPSSIFDLSFRHLQRQYVVYPPERDNERKPFLLPTKTPKSAGVVPPSDA